MKLKEALDKAPVVSYNDQPPIPVEGPAPNPANQQTALIRLATQAILDGEVVEKEEEWEAEQYDDDLEQAVEFVQRSKEIFKFYCDGKRSNGIIAIKDRIEMMKLIHQMEKWIDSLELSSDIPDVPPNDPAYAYIDKNEVKHPSKCPKCQELLLIDKEMWAIYCPSTQSTEWQGHYFEAIPEDTSVLEFEVGTPDNVVKLAEKITEQLGGV